MTITLTADPAGTLVRLETGAGLDFLAGPCGITTDRGLSRPGNPSRLGLLHRLHHRRLSARAVEFWHTLQNGLSKELRISRITLFDGTLEPACSGWKVLHAELFKAESYFGGFSFFTRGLLEPLTQGEGTFGLSEDLPFPGIFFHHPDRGTLLMATLSQDRCKPVWTLRRRGRTMHLTAEEGWTGIPAIPVGPEQTVSTERWVLLHTCGGIPQAIDEYYRLLKKRLSFVGANSILREAILWGSWNYNTRPRGYCDITHDYIVRNAAALKQLDGRRPAFVMIDDGYQRGCSGKRDTSFHGIDSFYPDLANAHDPALFPHGMKATAQAIRKAGVRPALWSSPVVRMDTRFGRAHRDWVARLDGSRRWLGKTAWLDYSLPEVREYVRGCWRTIFQDWGYDGLKLDFWTHAFEVPEVRYRRPDRTGIELRNQFLQDIRELVPPDGYILTGCCTNAGNPFIGRYADAARSSLDIGGGTWSEVLRSAQWQTVAAMFYRGDALLCDADSFGWTPGISREENETWATLALVSGSVCEIGGDLTALASEAQRLVKTAMRFIGPRGGARSNLLDSLGALPADHWQVETHCGMLESWINWSSSPRRIRFAKPVRNIWTGERLSGTHLLPAHATVLAAHRRE